MEEIAKSLQRVTSEISFNEKSNRFQTFNQQEKKSLEINTKTMQFNFSLLFIPKSRTQIKRNPFSFSFMS